MASRSWRFLTLALVLAAASPPPRVTNALIASSPVGHSTEPGKTLQSRARNRIGPAVQLAACPAIASLSAGPSKPPRPWRPPALRADRRITPPAFSSPHPIRAPLRLRC